MELEKIKDIWKTRDNSSDKVIPIYDMNSIVRKKSLSVIARMKRNLLSELIVVLVLYSIGVTYFLTSGFEGIALLLGLIGVCFLIYYYYKNRLLHKMSCYSCKVKANLVQQLGSLNQYMKFYAVATSVLIPLTFIAAWFILSDVHGLTFPLSGSEVTFFILFLTLGIVVSVTTYFINKVYVQRLYGRHISKLKNLLNEIKEVE